MDKLERLQRLLGYSFCDLGLLNQALTHRSVGTNNNERLEFLGDFFLNYVIAECIFHRFPELDEGSLSRITSNLIRRETLADLGARIGISEYIFLGVGERKNVDRNRKSIVADVMEALAGAVLLDGGFHSAKKILLEWYSEKLSDLSQNLARKDPKTEIQEYAQARGFELPKYEVEFISGEDHERVYHVTCTVIFSDYIGRGSGTSRQEAEQGAASQVLSSL